MMMMTAVTAVVANNRQNAAIEAQAEAENHNIAESYRAAQEQSREADAQAFQQRTDRANAAARQIALARVAAAEGRGSLASMAVNITGAEADDMSRIDVNNANMHSSAQQQIGALHQRGLDTAAGLRVQASNATATFATSIAKGALAAGATYYENKTAEAAAKNPTQPQSARAKPSYFSTE